MHPLYTDALAASRRRDLDEHARARRAAPRRPRNWFGARRLPPA